MSPSLSLIVNSVDSRRFRFFETCFASRLSADRIEVIRVSDAQSMSEGYNRGGRRASGEWLLFCHDDIALLSRAPEAALKEAMAESDMFGVCGTRRLVSGNWYDAGQPHIFGAVVDPEHKRAWSRALQIFGLEGSRLTHGIEAVDGILIGCRREVFIELEGFDEANFSRFVGYDIDFSYRAFLRGYRVAVNTGLLLLHLSNQESFVKSKYQEWLIAQVRLRTLFGETMNSRPGVRGHRVIPLKGPNPFEAEAVLEATRLEMSRAAQLP